MWSNNTRINRFAVRFGRAFLVSLFAVGVDCGLSRTPHHEIQEVASYEQAQHRLQETMPLEATEGWAIIDLSRLVAKRREGALVRGFDDSFLAGQWLLFAQCLRKIALAKPKGVLIDWELGLNSVYLDPNGSWFKVYKSTNPEMVAAYGHLMGTINEIRDSGIPIFFASNEVVGRVANEKHPFPEPDQIRNAATANVMKGSLGRFAALSPYESYARPPHFASHQVLKQLGLPDKLSPGLFQTRATSEGVGFFINYGFVAGLLKRVISESPLGLEKKSIQAQLTGKIVMIGDISEPAARDRFVAPMPEHAVVSTPTGHYELDLCPGALLLACAMLTRSDGVLSVAPKPEGDLVIVLVLSFFFAWFAEWIAYRWVGDSHTHQSELKRVAVEFGFIPLPVLLAWVIGWLTPYTHFLFLVSGVFVIARVFDPVLSFLKVLYHLHRHP